MNKFIIKLSSSSTVLIIVFEYLTLLQFGQNFNRLYYHELKLSRWDFTESVTGHKILNINRSLLSAKQPDFIFNLLTEDLECS